jgi:hypothetical protein
MTTVRQQRYRSQSEAQKHDINSITRLTTDVTTLQWYNFKKCDIHSQKACISDKTFHWFIRNADNIFGGAERGLVIDFAS